MANSSCCSSCCSGAASQFLDINVFGEKKHCPKGAAAAIAFHSRRVRHANRFWGHLQLFFSSLFGSGQRQVFLILVPCGGVCSASDTISVCFSALVCFLPFFAQEFLSISAVRFLCSAHLQFVRCLVGKKWMPEVTSTLRASAPVCCVSHFAPNQDRPLRRPLPSPQRIIALVRSGKWNWVHVFEPQQIANWFVKQTKVHLTLWYFPCFGSV